MNKANEFNVQMAPQAVILLPSSHHNILMTFGYATTDVAFCFSTVNVFV